MNRRLRKKLYLEEFAVLGVEFSCLISKKSDASADMIFDTIIDLIESRNLFIDGSGSEKGVSGYITSKERYGSVTEEDISAIKAALEAMQNITDIKVAKLSDAYYGENVL